MIYWNHKIQDQIQTTIQNYQNSQKWGFLIFYGPDNVGKSSFGVDLAHQILGDYFLQDFLHIRDFGKNLGKSHTIRIENKDSETSKKLLKEYNYTDLWVREINNRLDKAPVGNYKILLIENIDRMNTSATNAFLKTCEEPNPNNIIIATTSNPKSILETVLSRAFLFKFEVLSDADIGDFITNKLSDSRSNYDLKFLTLIASGRPGFLSDILLSKNTDWLWVLDFVSEFENISHDSETLIFKFLQRLDKSGFLNTFVSIISFDEKYMDRIVDFQNIVKNINIWISKDNSFMNFAIGFTNRNLAKV